jgi:hypothetical protein
MKKQNLDENNPYYHEEMTYDSKNENWSGLMSLLLVPVFILLVGWGVVTTFQLPKNAAGGNANDDNNFQIGVGGGPGEQTTPYKVPSITISPVPTQDGLYYIQ